MRKIIVLLIFMNQVYITYSQRVTLKAGLNMNQIELMGLPYNVKEINFMHNFQTGTGVDLRFARKNHILFFQTEIIYTQKKNFLFSDDNHYISTNFDYIEVPINIKIAFPISPWFFAIGIYGAAAFEGYNKYLINNQIVEQKIDFLTDKIPFYDYGVQGSIGLKRGLGYNKYFIELRYYKGMLNLSMKPNSKLYNNNLGITLGVLMSNKR